MKRTNLRSLYYKAKIIGTSAGMDKRSIEQNESLSMDPNTQKSLAYNKGGTSNPQGERKVSYSINGVGITGYPTGGK